MPDSKEPLISRIAVAGRQIGLRDIAQAFESVRARNIDDKRELGCALVDEVRKMKNYIAESVEHEYETALLREYRRFLGEAAEPEEKAELSIRILGRGCPNCRRLTQEVMEVLTDLGLAADVEHITDVNQIAEYGAIGTPALLINRKVKSVGRVPSRNQIWQWIKNETEEEE